MDESSASLYSEAAEFFRGLLRVELVVTDKDELAHLGTDWTSIFAVNPSMAVFPETTVQVSKILAYCHGRGLSVVPSGGRTGLAAAAVATNGEVVLSLSRMNKILNVDTVGLAIEAESGVTTQQLQEAAGASGFFFPLDLAAKGSCQLGGNIATNAGGLKLIRYGGTREQVLGLEVVLANGEILDLNYNLRKNNTGYDLKQLFLGAEGTLGVVTKATVKMVPKPNNTQLCCLGLGSFSAILRLLEACNLEGFQVTAFEYFTREAHEIVQQHFPEIQTPFEQKQDFYVLLEVEGGVSVGESGVLEPFLEPFLEAFLEAMFEDGTVIDGVIAQSEAEFNKLWALRENITESLQAHGHVRKNDIALPIARLGEFVAEMEGCVSNAPSDIQVVLFGHIGDGNLHLNYIGNKNMTAEAFHIKARMIEETIFELLPKFRGSISAEHGIGLLKKEDLHYSRSELEISIMRKLKSVFDPTGILNPGKIF